MADIIINDVSSRVRYTATAGQTIFNYNFATFSEGDLDVFVNGALQTIVTNYTVTGAGTTAGGTVSYSQVGY